MAKKLFTKENQPPGERKSVPKFRTLMLNALKERGVDEKGFVRELVNKALEPGQSQSVYLSELLKRYAPIPKSTLDTVVISDFNQMTTTLQKAECVFNAMATGQIPPDVGSIFIESINKIIAIEEITEIKTRLEALEKSINREVKND
jgi:hypothetical protein